MFCVVITRTPDQFSKQHFFDSLREARGYFNQIIGDKTFAQAQVRLIEKRDYCHSFLLDIHIINSSLGRKRASSRSASK